MTPCKTCAGRGAIYDDKGFAQAPCYDCLQSITHTQPWHPITDAVDLKHLGKLAEECGELSSAVARCIIQGIYECDPTTGKPNRQWLTEEIADVLANAELVRRRFQLDYAAIASRASFKAERLRHWHAGAAG
jgi:NTP pyrophosphatase (non-canonical NTP hydrolase)